jgi:hypothetical protein
MSGAVQRAARPRFADVETAYPRAVSPAALFDEIGIGELLSNPAYRNTCAIRVSYALTKAGVTLPRGGLRINKGPFKGKRIEAGMRRLADQLVELWGLPQTFASDATAVDALALKKGVVAFLFGETIPLVGAQGHIDLLQPEESVRRACLGSCFFGPRNKVWFWELN